MINNLPLFHYMDARNAIAREETCPWYVAPGYAVALDCFPPPSAGRGKGAGMHMGANPQLNGRFLWGFRAGPAQGAGVLIKERQVVSLSSTFCISTGSSGKVSLSCVISSSE
jgi:hypothetical protein